MRPAAVNNHFIWLVGVSTARPVGTYAADAGHSLVATDMACYACCAVRECRVGLGLCVGREQVSDQQHAALPAAVSACT